MRYILILMLLMSGCVAPNVEIYKTIFVHSKDKVTINMNSGTAIEAQIDQDVKDVIDATIPLR